MGQLKTGYKVTFNSMFDGWKAEYEIVDLNKAVIAAKKLKIGSKENLYSVDEDDNLMHRSGRDVIIAALNMVSQSVFTEAFPHDDDIEKALKGLSHQWYVNRGYPTLDGSSGIKLTKVRVPSFYYKEMEFKIS
ncbi:DUF2528 family protein [Acanthopleuribacter pedis]|uniref:DUF2528 family protein n=1 Tax=Acanthopleuribacter pedis TaxID=442870 RepID=A0A8J7QIR3_9BACT|nr:DUF2528 family protein [Acanthopleuribacter pedis]MBO1323130.1 DUF2528 family protein [Acanthopleuribacter pedis]